MLEHRQDIGERTRRRGAVNLEAQRAGRGLGRTIQAQGQRRAIAHRFDALDIGERRCRRVALAVIGRKGRAIAGGKRETFFFAEGVDERFGELFGPTPRGFDEPVLERVEIDVRQRARRAQDEMNPSEHRIVEQCVETVDLGREGAFENGGKALAQRGVVAVARHVDEAGHKASERIAAHEKRDALALLQTEDTHGDVIEIVLGGLEQLVARKGLEDMRERLAIMARRLEAAAGKHAGHFAPQQRNRARRTAIGERGEKAEEEAHADDIAARVKKLDADRVHMHRPMYLGTAAGFADEQELRTAQEHLHIGRKRGEIPQPVEDAIGGIAQDTKARRDSNLGRRRKAIFAAAEIGEIVVVEPSEEIERLGALGRAHGRLAALDLAARFSKRIAHLAPILDRRTGFRRARLRAVS